MIKFLNAEKTKIAFTDERGKTWENIPFVLEGGLVRVTGTAPTQVAAQAWIDAGNVPQEYEPPPLDEVKARLTRLVNDDAEAFRQRHITPGDGMAMTYREKFEQAKAVAAAGQESADGMTDGEAYDAYPTLFASVGREAPSLWECALLVIARAEAWADLSHDIEAKRMDGKAAIEAASTVADAESAYASITWE